MHSLNLNIPLQQFLDEYWQRKPLVIRQGFTNFIDPIDENDLAGLAQEESIDSRLVSHHKGKWSLDHGPFESFEDVCKGQWTLMVQGVDRWVEDVDNLARTFSFIPHWRFDDVMVSYAVPGAGVGPHVDQYDVFLIQGKGKRHWQVGKPENVKTVDEHEQLRQVEQFEPIIDVELAPGDILYIPPGWPHAGSSVEPSLTYSIGFRAPNVRDLLQPINDTLFNHEGLARYSDAGLSKRKHADDVLDEELDILTELVSQSLNSVEWRKTLLAHLSDQGLPVTPPETPFSEAEVAESLEHGDIPLAVPGCRPLSSKRFDDILFINGELISVSGSNRIIVQSLCSNTCKSVLPTDDAQKLALVQVVTILINNGALFFED